MKYLLLLSLILVSSTLFLASCNDEDESPSLPVISSFTPTSGIVGDEITITGKNFGATAIDNQVFINGIVADVISASPTEIVISVPNEAITGKIEVMTAGNRGLSASDFTVPAPTIAFLSTDIGSPGLTVKITGTNFSPVTGNNAVTFGTTPAVITSASGTELAVTVPANVTSGKVNVKVGTQTVSSGNSFQACINTPELVVSNIVITNMNVEKTQFTFNYTVTNVGSVDLDMSKYVLQNWVSDDAIYNAGDAAAGGTILSAAGTLSQGQSYQGSWQSTVATAKNFLIVTALNDQVTECSATNNVVAKMLQ